MNQPDMQPAGGGQAIVIFGASGMIGCGVLREALDSPAVASVLSIGRRTVELEHPKLRQLTHDNFEDFSAIADELQGLDACFWCLGTTSVGLDEAAYTKITYDLTMAAAKVLYEQSPEMRFCFVSGSKTDATERGRVMWARVKGKAENALRAMAFREVIIFRPAFVRSMKGCGPRGTIIRILYAVFAITFPLFRAVGAATSTVEMGKAMIAAALGMSDKQVLDSPDINELAARIA
jgi:hypothetical protein